MILIISILSLLIMGCSEDAPTATADCAALETAVEEAGTAFDASQTTATCTALVTAAQAALTGGAVHGVKPMKKHV